jgi:ABC-type uncharacterized transport system permease subunit
MLWKWSKRIASIAKTLIGAELALYLASTPTGAAIIVGCCIAARLDRSAFEVFVHGLEALVLLKLVLELAGLGIKYSPVLWRVLQRTAMAVWGMAVAGSA